MFMKILVKVLEGLVTSLSANHCSSTSGHAYECSDTPMHNECSLPQISILYSHKFYFLTFSTFSYFTMAQSADKKGEGRTL